MGVTDDEVLVRDWLCRRGYAEPEFEPRMVTGGRCPDFLVAADGSGLVPEAFWAEVKSLDPTQTARAISKISPILKKLSIPADLNGDAMLHVTPITREQSVRALVKMFQTQAKKYRSERIDLVFIQQTSGDIDIRYLEVTGEIEQKVWVRGAGSANVAVPIGAIEDCHASVMSQGRVARAFRVFDWRASFDCALLAHIDPKGLPLTSIYSRSDGTSDLTERALAAIKDANAQLRNVYKLRSVPGIVFLITSEDRSDDLEIANAAYGRLTISINTETLQWGNAFYGRDGAFRPDKNTHVSAVISLRRNAEAATYFPNPYAREQIDEKASLFSGLQRAAVTFSYG